MPLVSYDGGSSTDGEDASQPKPVTKSPTIKKMRRRISGPKNSSKLKASPPNPKKVKTEATAILDKSPTTVPPVVEISSSSTEVTKKENDTTVAKTASPTAQIVKTEFTSEAVDKTSNDANQTVPKICIKLPVPVDLLAAAVAKELSPQTLPVVDGCEAIDAELAKFADAAALDTQETASTSEPAAKKCKTKCFFCDEKPKYYCPCCNRGTCSVECCKKHKTMFACPGLRTSTTFVAKNDYRETTFRRDIHFLEELSRGINSSAKHSKAVLQPINQQKSMKANKSSNMRLVRLRDRLKEHCDIELLLLPSHFERHKRNTSRWVKQPKHSS